jgi:hypothetical protein
MASITIAIGDHVSQSLQDAAAKLGVSPEQVAGQVLEQYFKSAAQDLDDVRLMYPYMAKVFGPAGWDDPEMDEYDALDPRRPS